MRRLCLGLIAFSAFAQAPSDQEPNPAQLLGPLKDVVTKVFTAKPVHITIKSIAPGGGEAFGPIYTWDHPSGDWHSIYTLEGEASIRRFWAAQSRLRLLHPSFFRNTGAGDSFLADFYARTRDMPLLPFYGIGPNTARSSLTNYAERETSVGVRVVNPLTKWFGIGGTFEGLFPDVYLPDRDKAITTQQSFGERGAPGVTNQPSFLHSSFFLHPYHRYPAEIDSNIGYHFYRDNARSGYSFHRLRTDLTYNFYPVHHASQPVRDNVLSIRGLYELSFANGRNRVPFYLQNTLGGSDINNQSGLRGFSDMRFRGPNLLLIQTQYEKRLYSAFGMLAFYDTGRVANEPGQLTFSAMRHSFGFGGNIWLEGKVMFRAYVGLGSGEGVHPFFGIANFF